MSLGGARTTIIISVVFIALLPVFAKAQSAAPRDYLNTPVDAVSVFADFMAGKSVTAPESELPLPNTEAVSRLGIITALYSFPLGNKYGGVAVNGGYSTVEVNGPAGTLRKDGFIDPSVFFHANIFGAPALRVNQFSQVPPQTFFSFHLQITTPLGSYDRNSPVNVGTNRWAFTPIVNLSITPDKGVSWVDLYAGARFFTNNNAFLGNEQLAQLPLAIITGHYSHNLGKTWASFGVYYDMGGETIINHVPQHDAAYGLRPTVTVCWPIGRLRFKLRYDNMASKPNAAPSNGALFLSLLTGPIIY